MAQWFEDITKTMADEKMGRRTAMRRVVGYLTAVVLTAAVPGLAKGKGKKQCSIPGDCSIGWTQCDTNINPTDCYCFTDNGERPTGKCGCNQNCSQVQSCYRDSQCPSGFFCSGYNGCTNCMGGPVTAGVCLHYCQKICPPINHTDLTATSRAH